MIWLLEEGCMQLEYLKRLLGYLKKVTCDLRYLGEKRRLVIWLLTKLEEELLAYLITWLFNKVKEEGTCHLASYHQEERLLGNLLLGYLVT